MSARGPRRRPAGLRREVVILVPVAFFLLVVLSIFVLFSYRSGIGLLVEERRGDALLLGERVASAAAEGGGAGLDLRGLAPAARGIAVLDADGRSLARSGNLAEGPLLPPADGAGARQARAFGPEADLDAAIVALVPVPSAGPARWVRVELGAPALALQRRGLRVLTWLVLGVDAALVVLVVLFLGRILEPYETLLEHARSAGEVPAEAEDEVHFLVDTFERALAALARPREEPEGDPIELLQRTLAASFESGMLLLDREGRVLAVNATGAQLLEIDPLDADPRAGERARPLDEVLARHPELRRLLSEAASGGRGVRRREVELATPSGRPLTLGLTVHPLRGGAGAGSAGEEAADGAAPRGYLVLFVDLTEVRRRAEQARLAESLQHLGELAAGVAHELRNSLATLKGYLTLIERADRTAGRTLGRTAGGSARGGSRGGGGGADAEAAAPGAVAEYVEEIRRESDHLQRVLEDFLSFARPGTARLEEVDLHQVLARAAADPVLAGARVRLCPPPAGGLRLSGDPQLLERAFRNLLHNAAEASREDRAGGAGGAGEAAVEVAAAATEEGLEVTVADRGPGVPDEVKERLFHPFASGRPGGVGLGLALARRIVVLHGGSLELEDRPGGGTVARALLPSGRIVTEGNDHEDEAAAASPPPIP